MATKKPIWILIGTVVIMALIPVAGQASDFPNKPITLICPYPAGGATDVVIRPLAASHKARKVMSVAPPAPQGITMVMGDLGKSAA
jgi:hypothetical protein